MDAQEYAKQKAEPDQWRSESRGPENAPQLSPGPYAPPQPDLNFEGLNQTESGGLFPPDTHGAIGKKPVRRNRQYAARGL